MKTVKRVMWGLVLVILGALWLLDACGVLEFDLFFDGWWTLFIIVPCFIGLITEKDKLGAIFGIVIGVFLFLACNDILTFELFWRILIPTIVILIGCRLIFGHLLTGRREKARKKAEKKIYDKGGELKEYCATFSGMDLNFDGETFHGASLTAVFGSIKCDLRGAVIEDDAVITVSSVFGGIDILLPEHISVSVTVKSIFGGVSDGCRSNAHESDPTVYIGGNCIFGGVDIK